jgi:putative two-component system response regulator
MCGSPELRVEKMAETDAQSDDKPLILAVDDNEQNLQLVQEYLWSWGFEVVVARDGVEAIEQFHHHSPELVLLDVMMPNMDGYEACSRIKSTASGRMIPIVMLTALTSTDEKIRALDHGADDFLTKPINRQELRARISSLIRIRNLRRELDSSEDIIVTLTAALERKHARTAGHAQRVASYSALLAEKLGFSEEDRQTIIKAALLHDLGLIGVDDEILAADGALSEGDRLRMQQHPIVGASILRPMRTFQRFIPAVRWHHERFDGSGYPDGLVGSQIPIEAQIVGIANRLEELHHQDGVRTQQETLEILAAEARDGAWDPELVEVLSRALRDEPVSAPERRYRLKKPYTHPSVLYVDDEESNHKLLDAHLSGEGLVLIHAGSGDEALEVLSRETVDIALVDLHMPGMGGMTLIDRIRRQPELEFLPIIVVTAERSDGSRKEAIVAGADDFLTHPVHRLELTTRIRSLLRISDYRADLEQTENVITALALAIEAKDEYTRGHSQRVADLSYQFALHLGYPESDADRIRTAGLLHDIGKIAVPESLLNKTGPLTRDEFMRVIDHPVIGEEICRPLSTLAAVLKLIRHHHERYDGRGYPDGLRGEEIPRDIRLLSIVDAYDALTSHRAYRTSPLSHTAAIETLRREASAGKWDTPLVEKLIAMLGPEPPDFSESTLQFPRLHLE